MSGRPEVYPHVVAWLAYFAPARRAPLRILEAGCGGGQYASKLGQHTWIGFDIPDTWYERVRPPSFYASAEHIPLASGAVDVVFSVAAFDYFENPEQVLQEFHRVLRPGGHCLIFTYDEATLQQIHRNCLVLPQTAAVRGHHVTGPAELDGLARATGFPAVLRLPYMPWSRPIENAKVLLRSTNHRTYALEKPVT